VILLAALAPRTHIRARYVTAPTEMVKGDVPGDAQDPSKEGYVSLLVLWQYDDYLGEHMLRDVLSRMMIANDALNVAIDVVCVAHIEITESRLVAELRPDDHTRHGPVVLRSVVERCPQPKARAAAVVGIVGCGRGCAGHLQIHTSGPSERNTD
jgi:hypothetical protein